MQGGPSAPTTAPAPNSTWHSLTRRGLVRATGSSPCASAPLAAAALEGNALAHQLRDGSRREGASARRVTGGPGPGGEASRLGGGVIGALYALRQAVFQVRRGAKAARAGSEERLPGVPRTGPRAAGAAKAARNGPCILKSRGCPTLAASLRPGGAPPATRRRPGRMTQANVLVLLTRTCCRANVGGRG